MTGHPSREISSPRLRRLARDLESGAVQALSGFWSEVERQGTPLIEPGPDGFTRVTFLWRDDGETNSIAVIQDWGADGIREHFMARLPGSDVWFLTRVMRPDTRTTYQLSPSAHPDPSQAAPYRLDPLNPKVFTAYPSETGADILFSLLELQDAPGLPWRSTPANPVVTKPGAVRLHTPFADGRRLWVYTPAEPHPAELPALVVFDGRLYKEQLVLPQMLDTLIGTGRIPPAAALMVDNPDRSELICRPEYGHYVAGAVMPWFREAYPVFPDPGRTVVVGSSYGGLAAVYCVFLHPGLFGNVLSQTGWFRWRPEGSPDFHWLAAQIAAAPPPTARFWLQVGSLEEARMLDGGPTQLAANRHMRDVLEASGCTVSYREYAGGHDASSLEAPLAEGIVEILGASRTV